MAKTITISKDAYEILVREKREGESFSDVIRRLSQRKSIMDLAGAWKDMTDEEYDEWMEAIGEKKRR